jgi:hypothetical protein
VHQKAPYLQRIFLLFNQILRNDGYFCSRLPEEYTKGVGIIDEDIGRDGIESFRYVSQPLTL